MARIGEEYLSSLYCWLGLRWLRLRLYWFRPLFWLLAGLFQRPHERLHRRKTFLGLFRECFQDHFLDANGKRGDRLTERRHRFKTVLVAKLNKITEGISELKKVG